MKEAVKPWRQEGLKMWGICEIRREDLDDPEEMARIIRDRRTYYWSDDWSPGLYVALARAGFISTGLEVGGRANHPLLIPEVQTAYALLDWERLHVSRSMHRWMGSEACLQHQFQLRLGIEVREIAGRIAAAHPDNWLNWRYLRLLEELQAGCWKGFELVTVGLVTGGGRLVAGEIGYRTGRIYTSLTGFFDREGRRFGRTGTLQLWLLGQLLRDQGFAFWNLGHPHMPYKLALGAVITPRREFLRRWGEEVEGDPVGTPES